MKITLNKEAIEAVSNTAKTLKEVKELLILNSEFLAKILDRPLEGS